MKRDEVEGLNSVLAVFVVIIRFEVLKWKLSSEGT